MIWPRRTLASDSWWAGVSPDHEHRASAERNRDRSPIWPTNTAAKTHPVDGLDGVVAPVVPQGEVDLAVQRGDLPVDDYQVAQDLDAVLVGVSQLKAVELAAPRGTHMSPGPAAPRSWS